MMYWNGEWGWFGWLTMTLMMLVFWGMIVWFVIGTVQSFDSDSRTPMEILAERFARGEIDEDEYNRRCKALRDS